jgi:hypothetical protein
MAAVTSGTSCTYGIAGTVTNLFVQSYTISASFNNESMVQDEAGLTKTARYDDRKTELTVEGVVKSGATPVLGATLTFTGAASAAYPSGSATNSFTGVVTKVEEVGSSKDFVKVKVTAVKFEGA